VRLKQCSGAVCLLNNHAWVTADTKTDTKTVKNGLFQLSKFKLICSENWAFLSRNCGENRSIPTLASICKLL
jgi:hypothetical protein